jgi:hypothetical protein
VFLLLATIVPRAPSAQHFSRFDHPQLPATHRVLHPYANTPIYGRLRPYLHRNPFTGIVAHMLTQRARSALETLGYLEPKPLRLAQRTLRGLLVGLAIIGSALLWSRFVFELSYLLYALVFLVPIGFVLLFPRGTRGYGVGLMLALPIAGLLLSAIGALATQVFPRSERIRTTSSSCADSPCAP